MTSDQLMAAVAEASSLPAKDRISAARLLLASIGAPKVEMPSSMTLAQVNRLLESVERIIEAFPPGEPTTKGFSGWLDSSLGAGKYPEALAGDLASLLINLESLYQRLCALSLGGAAPLERSNVLAQLWALKFDLEQSLRPLTRDLAKQLSEVVPRRATGFRK